MQAVALLLADARLPIGGHARSASLEGALAAGVTDVPGYIALRLRTVVRTDAATAVVTRELCRHQSEPDLTQVIRAWQARTPSAAVRADAELVGRALRRLATRLWQLTDLPDPAPGPVVLGAIAARTDLPATDLARLIGYDDIQTVVSAALKLRPLDPLAATEWVLSAFDDLERLVEQTSTIVSPHQIPAASAPTIEAYAEAHARTSRRLFRA